MRLGHTLAIVTTVLVAMADIAAADTVVARGRTRMRSRAGEMARVVKILRPGQKARIVRVRGRWYKIRVGKRSGWVTRTTVRRLGKRTHKRVHHWGRRSSKRYGAWREQSMVAARRPDLPATLRVTIDRARAFKRPSARSKTVFAVNRGAELRVLAASRRRRWYLVQTDDSAPAWIAAAAVSTARRPAATALAATTRVATATPSPAVTTRRAAEPPHVVRPPADIDGLRLSVGLGVHSLATHFRSDGASGLGNYDLDSNAANVLANLGFYTGTGRFAAAAFAQYRGAYASPGLHYEPSAGGSGDVSTTAHAIDARLALGMRVTDEAAGGARLYVVAGYGYEVTMTDDLNNIARLPNESLRGGLVGGRVELPRLTDDVSMTGSLNLLVGAKLGQTEGLMDGATATVSGVRAHVGLSKRLTGSWHLVADYCYDKTKLHFSGASSRQPDVTKGTRTDRAHTVVVGIGRRM